MEAQLNLPTGNYDVPLVLASKQYSSTGAVLAATAAGDTIEVNGQLYPFLNVEPRKYRFRFLNGAATRTFSLQFYTGTTTTTALPFQIIASDGGYMRSPVSATLLKMGMGERYEIIFDFASYAGSTLTLYDTLGQAMSFVVENDVTDDTNNDAPPSTLRDIQFLEQPTSSAQTFTFANTK